METHVMHLLYESAEGTPTVSDLNILYVYSNTCTRSHAHTQQTHSRGSESLLFTVNGPKPQEDGVGVGGSGGVKGTQVYTQIAPSGIT